MTAPTKADAAAAERLLKAAVKRAVAMLRDRPAPQSQAHVTYPTAHPVIVTHYYPGDSLDRAEAMLRAAGESAELLLSERAT